MCRTQGNDKDVFSKETDHTPIQNVECNAQSFGIKNISLHLPYYHYYESNWLFFTSCVNTDTSELQDASASTVQKPKEGENAKTIMMKDQEVYYSIFTIYLYYHISNCNIYDYTLRMPKVEMKVN